MIKKVFKFLFLVIFVAFWGGVGAIVLQSFVLPLLVAYPFFGKIPTLNNNVTTIINKTEELVIKPDEGKRRVLERARNSVATVFSVSTTDLRGDSFPEARNVGRGLILTGDGVIALHRGFLSFGPDIEYRVFFSSGEKASAEVVGTDVLTGISFLRVKDKTNLPTIDFAAERDIFIGQDLLTVGTTEQLDTSAASAELVGRKYLSSAFERAETFGKYRPHWTEVLVLSEIDPSRPIILTAHGRLLGLLGVSPSSESDAVTKFVIPVQAVRTALERFLSDKLSFAPEIGFVYGPVATTELLRANFESRLGAAVERVSASGPAAEAGILPGDVIIAVDDREVSSPQDLTDILSAAAPGKPLTVRIRREKEEKELEFVPREVAKPAQQGL